MAGGRLLASLMAALFGLLVVAGCSSNAETVVFTSDRNGTSGIYLSASAPGKVKFLTGLGLTAHSPRWSPDRQKVAFLVDRDGAVDIFLQDIDATEATQLTNTPEEETRLRWSPDGKALAYLVKSPESSQHVEVMDLGTLQARRLTSGFPSEADHGWSGDGQMIIFAAFEDGDAPQGLYIRNPTGVNEVKLTSGLDSAPAWGPRGEAVVFQSLRDGNLEVYRLDLRNGVPDGEPVRLTDNPASDHSPTWSPDGKWVAFISERDDNPEVYVMTPEGADLQRLSFNHAEERSLVWSRDNRLVFVSDVNGSDDVFVMDPNGERQDRLTLSMARDWQPHW